ncbi:MAG TPA: amidase, partial [Methylomirabilota bacterium]
MSTGAADLAFAGAARQAALIREKRLSPVELVTTYLDRIGRLDGHLRAFITVCSESALAEAERAEAEAAQGAWRGPLHGVPFAVKDQLDTAGVLTTSGSALLKLHVPSEDSTVVAQLRAAGGILLGKLNLTEFALGGTLRFPYGQPRNPWNPEHDPGGSSSGSGIAAAAALCSLTLGEDTGGSVRSPASYCGAVGLRPTWGRVSRHGCFPAAWSMDQVGPLTRTVEDCALVLTLIAGYDAKDPTSSRHDVPDYCATLAAGAKGTRIGVITELVEGAETQAEVREAVREAARGLAALGATVEDISLPLIPHAGAVFMALCDSEAAGRHKPWLASRPEEYDAGTRRRLVAAGLIPAVPLHRAARARALIREQVLEALGRFDLLLAPTSPHPAPTISFHTALVTSK